MVRELCPCWLRIAILRLTRVYHHGVAQKVIVFQPYRHRETISQALEEAISLFSQDKDLGRAWTLSKPQRLTFTLPFTRVRLISKNQEQVHVSMVDPIVGQERGHRTRRWICRCNRWWGLVSLPLQMPTGLNQVSIRHLLRNTRPSFQPHLSTLCQNSHPIRHPWDHLIIIMQAELKSWYQLAQALRIACRRTNSFLFSQKRCRSLHQTTVSSQTPTNQ